MYQLLDRIKNKQPDDDGASGASSTVNLERVGRTRIEDLVSSAREVPWGLTLAQLLWTAGPVTFLALQGGSYLGYGEAVGFKTYLFFAVYIILGALIALVARIMAKSIRGNKEARARNNITRTLDLIPDLIFTARDLNLQTLSKKERKREAAATLLRKQDLESTALSVAVLDLTNDQVLAELAQEVEVFRRASMFSRIADLNAKYREYIDATVHHLKDYSGEIADILEERFQGIAPSHDNGVSRGENFINRAYAAAHQEDLSLMTLNDVEDILSVAFELLCGRSITRLIVGYEGDWQLARSLDELERSHNAYRQTKASAVLYLKELAYFLSNTGLTSLDHRLLNQNSDALLQKTSAALTSLVARLKWSGHAELKRNPAVHKNLKMALRYATLTRQTIARLEERYVSYVRALERWTMMRERLFDEGGKVQRGLGLRIRENVIALSDEQKLDFAAQFIRYLRDHRITEGARGVLRHDEPISIAYTKHLGIRIVLILQPLIGLDNPSVQRAIEGSRGAYLESLEMGFSADAKAGIGSAIVKELKEDLGPSAELIALRLTKVYRMPLSDTAIHFLVSQYGANRQRLEFLASSSQQVDADDAPPPIPHEPSMVRSYNEWRAPVEAAEGMLGQLLRQAGSS